MDPENVIPVAASYLEVGGAHEDWYAALYTYNHAYRRQAGDEGVDPYVYGAAGAPSKIDQDCSAVFVHVARRTGPRTHLA